MWFQANMDVPHFEVGGNSILDFMVAGTFVNS